MRNNFIQNSVFIISILLLAPFCTAQDAVKDVKDAENAKKGVTVERKELVLPTYEVGAPDENPLFFTGRVYQGAQGHFYPYPLYDVLTDNRVEKAYNALYLDNEYINVCVLPELGGRILSATSKENGYEFFYRQHVVKPALIGMTGAWMSGGVEWNIPHHHRPSSNMPIDWQISKDERDGSAAIWVGETELRHRMKWTVGLKVYPGRSYIEANVKIQNRSALVQSMLYWANVSVHCGENYQVIFPPKTHFGTGHSKTAFVRWPINDGVDISWWKNFTKAPQSVFAWNFDDDFLAGYDHGKEAGTVHVANHHMVGGKKFFLWGNNDSARMWDKMLTDEDGCYLELMVGAFSDNQPDYSWIAPGEVREFKQYWFPIRGIRYVKNATRDGAVNMERTSETSMFLGFCPTTALEGARILLKNGDFVFFDREFNTNPNVPFTAEAKVPAELKDSAFKMVVLDAKGRELLAYQPEETAENTTAENVAENVAENTTVENTADTSAEEPLPEPVAPTPEPGKIATNEELYLAGLRIEQFHNARLNPMDYYNEALKRDPGDARVHTVVGIRNAREGKWEDAEKHFQAAIERLGKNYTVLRDGEPHYYLGYVFQMTGRLKEAKDQYWKAAWTRNYASPAYFGLAQTACLERDFPTALQMVDESLSTNTKNLKAITLRAIILRKMGRNAEAGRMLQTVLGRDVLDFWSLVEMNLLAAGEMNNLPNLLAQRGGTQIALQEVLEMAEDYMAIGADSEALMLLGEAVKVPAFEKSPLILYTMADCASRIPELAETAEMYYARATGAPREHAPDFLFPFRVEERALFERVLEKNPDDSLAAFCFGNLLYYLNDQDAAIEKWELSTKLDPDFGRVWRCLGFAYSRKNQLEKAISCYETAVEKNPNDPRFLAELDVLYAKTYAPAEKRLALLESHLETVLKHDDAVTRLIEVYNMTGHSDKALAILTARHFRVWEGGGAIHNHFVNAHLISGLAALHAQTPAPAEALAHFEAALTYPENLEVGRSAHGRQDAKILYFAGLAHEALQQTEEAQKAFTESAAAENAPETLASELAYFQILSLRKIGKTAEADELLAKFRTAVEQKAGGNVKLDEFSKFGEDGTRSELAAEVSFYQGLAFALEGQTEKSRAALENALKANPNLLWAKIMLEN